MEYDIRFLPKKHVNYNLLEYLLKDSDRLNQYSNYGPIAKRAEKYYKEVLKIEKTKSVIIVNSATSALLIARQLFKPKTINTSNFNFRSAALLEGVRFKDSLTPLVNDLGLSYFGTYSSEIISCAILDAATSPYTFFKGENILNFHNASVVSLHHTKPIGFGEGGLLIVNNFLEKEARELVNFNIPNNEVLGGNYKHSELSIAGNLQYVMGLPNLDKIVKKLTDIEDIIKNELLGYEIQFLPDDSDSKLASCLPIIFDNKKEVTEEDDKIEIKKYYKPILPLPETTRLYKKILCYPLHYQLSYNDVEKIVDSIKRKYNEKSSSNRT